MVFILFPFCVLSQVDTLSIKYNIQATGEFIGGNNNNFTFNNTSGIIFENSRMKNSTYYTYRYGKQSGTENENEHFFGNSFNYKLKNKFFIPSVLEVERSFIRKIDIRYNSGLGIGMKPIKWLNISELITIDQTYYSDQTSLVIVRSSLRIKVNYIRDKFTIFNEMYIQPDFIGKYFRFRTNLNLSYKINKVISFVINTNESYEQYVINGRKNNDIDITIGILISNNK